MDPNTLANLDPKLRETYERVMGTASAASSTQTGGSGGTPPIPPPSADAPTVTPVDTFNTTPPAPSAVNTGPVLFDAMPNSTPADGAGANVSAPAVTGAENGGMVSSAPPIPPPLPSAPTVPTTPAEPTPSVMGQPIQPAELASLQASLTGTPLHESKDTLQLSKPLTPLPSPASVNQPAAQTATTTAASPVIKAMYFIAAVVFFIVYAVFWLKIFHYPLPF